MSRAAASLQAEGAGRFRLQGALTGVTVAALRQQGLQQFRHSDTETLSVDLRDVTAVDSAGLALLVDWLAWAEASGRPLQFSHLPPNLRVLAELSEVDSLLQAPAG